MPFCARSPAREITRRQSEEFEAFSSVMHPPAVCAMDFIEIAFSPSSPAGMPVPKSAEELLFSGSSINYRHSNDYSVLTHRDYKCS